MVLSLKKKFLSQLHLEKSIALFANCSFSKGCPTNGASFLSWQETVIFGHRVHDRRHCLPSKESTASGKRLQWGKEARLSCGCTLWGTCSCNVNKPLLETPRGCSWAFAHLWIANGSTKYEWEAKTDSWTILDLVKTIFLCQDLDSRPGVGPLTPRNKIEFQCFIAPAQTSLVI